MYICGVKHGSLFSGIGGFDAAAEWMGWENVFHCEWNEFGRKVLKYYWPDAISYGDITKTDFTIHRGGIDILTGGFPCQPYSTAGKRLGKEDERHLWPSMLRAIREIQPRYVVGENVSGLISWNGGMVFDEVQADLEVAGYEVIPFVLPAAGVNAPHRRDRVWFIARRVNTDTGLFGSEIGQVETMGIKQLRQEWTPQNPVGDGCLQREPDQDGAEVRQFGYAGAGDSIGVRGAEVAGVVADTTSDGREERFNIGQGAGDERPERFGDMGVASDTEGQRPKSFTTGSEIIRSSERQGLYGGSGHGFSGCGGWDNFPTQPPVRGRNDGISPELSGITVSKHRSESIKAYGNAIVPQVAYQIFKAIQEFENQTTKQWAGA